MGRDICHRKRAREKQGAKGKEQNKNHDEKLCNHALSVYGVSRENCYPIYNPKKFTFCKVKLELLTDNMILCLVDLSM